MNAEILAVGTELLMGQIANTNAQYISGRLPDVGIGVFYHSVVGDNPKRLKECLTIALDRSDTVIMTGGLGPTQDDLTKETVAEMLDRKLVLHNESLEKIRQFFEKINRPMVERKGATYYAIALAVRRIVEAIIRDENSILTVSSLLQGQYGLNEVCLSLPAIVNISGLDRILNVPLNSEEEKLLIKSGIALKELIKQLNI